MTENKDYDVLVNEKFVIKGRLTAENNYAEGVTQLFFGFPFTKVLFHSTIDPPTSNTVEIRKASQYLTLPTVTSIELANMILTAAKNSETKIMNEISGEAKSRIAAILQNYQVPQSTPKVNFPKFVPTDPTENKITPKKQKS